MPFKTGQRIRLRGGQLGRVDRIDVKRGIFGVELDSGATLASHAYLKHGHTHSDKRPSNGDVVANVGVPEKGAPEKAKLTLPLKIGQRVVNREGGKGEVVDNPITGMVRVRFPEAAWHYLEETGQWVRKDYDEEHPFDLVADDGEPEQKPTIDWAAIARERAVGLTSSVFTFADGRPAAFYNACGQPDGSNIYEVGIPSGMGTWDAKEAGDWATMKHGKEAKAFAKHCSQLGAGWRLWVSEDGTAVGNPSFQVVVPK